MVSRYQSWCWELTYHEEETELVIESIGTGSHELSLDVKATGCENDGK